MIRPTYISNKFIASHSTGFFSTYVCVRFSFSGSRIVFGSFNWFGISIIHALFYSSFHFCWFAQNICLHDENRIICISHLFLLFCLSHLHRFFFVFRERISTKRHQKLSVVRTRKSNQHQSAPNKVARTETWR